MIKSEISTTCPASNWKLSEKKHTYLEHQLEATASLNNIKKMCIFKQLQGQLQLVVINQENYINFFKLFPFCHLYNLMYMIKHKMKPESQH